MFEQRLDDLGRRAGIAANCEHQMRRDKHVDEHAVARGVGVVMSLERRDEFLRVRDNFGRVRESDLGREMVIQDVVRVCVVCEKEAFPRDGLDVGEDFFRRRHRALVAGQHRDHRDFVERVFEIGDKTRPTSGRIEQLLQRLGGVGGKHLIDDRRDALHDAREDFLAVARADGFSEARDVRGVEEDARVDGAQVGVGRTTKSMGHGVAFEKARRKLYAI